jgi:hypothetical protein
MEGAGPIPHAPGLELHEGLSGRKPFDSGGMGGLVSVQGVVKLGDWANGRVLLKTVRSSPSARAVGPTAAVVFPFDKPTK